MNNHTGYHNKEHCSPECPTCQTASLTPPWLIEFEKEQNNKLAILRKVVKIERDYTFVESAFGSREKKMRMQAMVNAYDVVLKLIDKAIGGK